MTEEHKQAILNREAATLSKMLEQMRDQQAALLTQIEALSVVRDAVMSQVGAEQLELDLHLD